MPLPCGSPDEGGGGKPRLRDEVISGTRRLREGLDDGVGWMTGRRMILVVMATLASGVAARADRR